MKIADTWLTPVNIACAPATSTNDQKVSWDLRPEQSRFCCDSLGPLLALSGHHGRADQCPLSGVKRTWHDANAMSGYDPKRTLPSAVLTTSSLPVWPATMPCS